MDLEKNVVPSKNNEHSGYAMLLRIPSKRHANKIDLPHYFLPDSSLKITYDLRRLEREQRKLIDKYAKEKDSLTPKEKEALAIEIRCKSVDKISLLKNFISFNEMTLAASFDLFAGDSYVPHYTKKFDEISTPFSAMASIEVCLVEAEKLRIDKITEWIMKSRNELTEGDMSQQELLERIKGYYNAQTGFNFYCYCYSDKPTAKEPIHIRCTVCQDNDPMNRAWYHHCCLGFYSVSPEILNALSFICPSCWIRGKIPDVFTFYNPKKINCSGFSENADLSSISDDNYEIRKAVAVWKNDTGSTNKLKELFKGIDLLTLEVSKEFIIENYCKGRPLDGWRALYTDICLFDASRVASIMERYANPRSKRLMEKVPLIRDESYPFIVEKIYEDTRKSLD